MTISVDFVESNVALTKTSPPVTTTVHDAVAGLPLHAPPHAANFESVPAVAVSVTSVGSVKTAVQVAPQSIGPGVPFTVPTPLPSFVIVRRAVTVLNATDTAVSTVTPTSVQVVSSTPAHAPPQANVAPGLGPAISVMLEPLRTDAEHGPDTCVHAIPPTLLTTMPLPVTVTVTTGFAARALPGRTRSRSVAAKAEASKAYGRRAATGTSFVAVSVSATSDAWRPLQASTGLRLQLAVLRRCHRSAVTVLGIDPGTAACGFGVVRRSGSELVALEHGWWSTPARERPELRLKRIHDEVTELIERFAPEVVVLEESYVGVDARTALSVGQARGAALTACANAGVPCCEYAPATVKQAVCGYGRADKAQVQRMVRAILRLDADPTPHHAADALAVAICHALGSPLLGLAGARR